jgi:hypothetical protein
MEFLPGNNKGHRFFVEKDKKGMEVRHERSVFHQNG